MLNFQERSVIQSLWKRKLEQDALGLSHSERHRNLEPSSAGFLNAVAVGIGAQRSLDIGGSSGISTIALASAARATGGKLSSIEIEPERQAEAKQLIHQLGLEDQVSFILGDAADILPTLVDMDFVLIDCEKEDYVRFFDMLKLGHNAIVVADSIISHELGDYVAHVRGRPNVESVTLPIGKGLEVSRKNGA